jgi:hypothetical protein
VTTAVYASLQDFDDLSGIADGDLANPGQLVASALASTDTLEWAGHGLQTGNAVLVRATEGGTLSSPLVAGTTYYAIRVTADTFKLATSSANATAGTAIDLTTNGVSMVVTKPLPITRYLEVYSRWVDDCLPAHLVPLTTTVDGSYPILVVRVVCQLAGKALLVRAGKDSKLISDGEVEAKAILERWAKGIPLRDTRATTRTNLAITSTARGETTDPRGWGTGTLP